MGSYVDTSKVGEDLVVKTCMDFARSLTGFIEAYDSSSGAYGGRRIQRCEQATFTLAVMYCNISSASPGVMLLTPGPSLEELKAATAK